MFFAASEEPVLLLGEELKNQEEASAGDTVK